MDSGLGSGQWERGESNSDWAAAGAVFDGQRRRGNHCTLGCLPMAQLSMNSGDGRLEWRELGIGHHRCCPE